MSTMNETTKNLQAQTAQANAQERLMQANAQERMGASPPVSPSEHALNWRACARPLLRTLMLSAALVMFSATTAVGQIWLDGEEQSGMQIWLDGEENGMWYENKHGDVVDLAMVAGDSPVWMYSPYIYTLVNNGSIDDATANGGTLFNGRGHYVVTEYAHGQSYIDIVNYYPGRGTITTANVNGGTLYNGHASRGTITTANVNDGTLYNGYGVEWDDYRGYFGHGTIETANVYGGDVYNIYGSIGTALLDNGNMFNGGRIGNMTYTCDFYTGYTGSGGFVYSGGQWVEVIATGSVGTLTLAGNSADNLGEWGIVEKLEFADDGSGLLTVTAAQTRSEGVTFISDIQADNVDFTNGNIALDLSGLGNVSDDLVASLFADGMFFTSLFGTEDVEGMKDLQSFQLARDDEWFYVLNDGVMADGWGVDFVSGVVTWDGTDIVWSSDVPEPATLAMVGLGLAGLGLARRRRS